jgi:hypothetical protein
MRSIVAALILCLGLVLPVATPGVAQESPPQFRVLEDTVLSLKPGDKFEGSFRVEGRQRIVFVVHPHGQPAKKRLFLTVGFWTNGKGIETILPDHNNSMVVDDVFRPGTVIEYDVRPSGPRQAWFMEEPPTQRATLLILVYPPEE